MQSCGRDANYTNDYSFDYSAVPSAHLETKYWSNFAARHHPNVNNSSFASCRPCDLDHIALPGTYSLFSLSSTLFVWYSLKSSVSFSKSIIRYAITYIRLIFWQAVHSRFNILFLCWGHMYFCCKSFVKFWSLEIYVSKEHGEVLQ